MARTKMFVPGPRKEKNVSTAALSRNPSKAVQGRRGLIGFGSFVWRLVRSGISSNRDARVLQTLPDHVLADIGLEKMEIVTGAGGDRHVWVIPHRYH